MRFSPGSLSRTARRIPSVTLRAALTCGLLFLFLRNMELRADFSARERGDHREQVEHLEHIVERHGRHDDEKEALLGLLILSDTSPSQSASCSRSLDGVSRSDMIRHELACPHCKRIVQIASQGLRVRTFTPTPTTRYAADLTHRARTLIDDGFGYVRSPQDLGADLSTAIRLLENAVLDSPDFDEALQLYGVLKELDGEPASAEKAFKKAINVCPTSAWGLNNVAVFYLRHALAEHAYYVLKFALESERDFRTARLLARLHESAAGAKLVPIAEAIRLMEWVVRFNYEDPLDRIVADRIYLDDLRRAQVR